MRICLIHFASSLLRIFLAKISFLEFLYGVLLVLSRCCLHHIVENSILYKKDIQHFYIGLILYSENKIIRSVVGGKVDGQILSGTRSEKRKNLFGTKWQFRKIVFGSQRVNQCATVCSQDVALVLSDRFWSFAGRCGQRLLGQIRSWSSGPRLGWNESKSWQHARQVIGYGKTQSLLYFVSFCWTRLLKVLNTYDITVLQCDFKISIIHIPIFPIKATDDGSFA